MFKVCSRVGRTVYVLAQNEEWTVTHTSAEVFSKKEADQTVKDLQEVEPKKSYWTEEIKA